MSVPRTTPPDPSEALRRAEQDPLLASVVRAAAEARDPACPDAEWLALYVEQELGASERGIVAPHLASCERCQAIVAAYERASVDAPEIPVFAAPEPEAGRGGLAGWLAGWRVLVPAASLVGVMVVAVWIGRGPADEVAESARKAEVTEAARQARVEEPTRPAEQSPIADNFVAPSGTVGSVTPTPGGARERARGLAQQTAPAQAFGGAARETAATQASRADAPSAGGASEARAKAAAPPPPVARQEATTAERETQASVAEAVSAPPVLAPVASRDAAAARPAPASAPAAAAAGAAAPAAPAPVPARKDGPVLGANDAVIAFETPPALWRARAGAVERSRNEGTTWQRMETPAGISVIAIASPSSAVCWAIAEHAVLRATDGATFTHEPVPSSERLTAVVASDAMNAVVTTASGARFVTANGGRTWRRGQ